ncbi:MAG: hypothetical protein EOP53_02110 [Sphingobacteriales bacterium]|nr:MAG: hypothetical protein EOP53_02110 [Sphingobacteriales bacterium]
MNWTQTNAQVSQNDTINSKPVNTALQTPQINTALNKTDADNKRGSFSFVASASVLYPFNDILKDSFSQKAFFMPGGGFYIGKNFSMFIEYARASASEIKGDKIISAKLTYFSGGFCNQAKVNNNISFRQKIAFNVVNIKTENLGIDEDMFLGFMAGAGFQTQATERFLLYIDGNYIYQKNNFGGLRLESGLILQF